MLYRSYLSKDNVIVNKDINNLGKNKILDLFHGINQNTNEAIFSRGILQIDLTELQEKYNSGEFCLSGNVLSGATLSGDTSPIIQHTLVLYNTISTNKHLEGGYFEGNFKRASSFDILLYTLPDHFDEGVGLDFGGKVTDQIYLQQPLSQYNNSKFYESSFNNTVSIEASNFLNSKTLEPWSISGTINDDISELTWKQHFETGSENLVIDITEYVNQCLLGIRENKGLGIKFLDKFENERVVSDYKYLGFFSRHVESVFEPYLETFFDDIIRDDRNKFYFNKINRLYLFTNELNKPFNLDDNPRVTILNENKQPILNITDIKCAGRGVYYIEFMLDQDGSGDDCGYFTDIWSNLIYKNGVLCDSINKFRPLPCDEYFNIGIKSKDTQPFMLKTSGISFSEKIKRGDKRRVNIKLFNPNLNQNEINVDDILYRIFFKDGPHEIEISPFTSVHRTAFENFFIVDTSWLIPNTYYIDIKTINGYDVITLEKKIEFEITSQKDKTVTTLGYKY